MGGSSGSSGSSGTDYGPIVSRVCSRESDLWSERATSITNNPYQAGGLSGARVAYDPSFYIDGMFASLNAFVATLVDFHQSGIEATDMANHASLIDSSLDNWSTQTLWESFIDGAKTKLDSAVLDTTAISSYASDIGGILQTETDIELGKFYGGMRDINAVQSSTFVIGAAIIQAAQTKAIAKITGDLTAEAWRARNLGIIETGKLGLEVNLKTLTLRGELLKSVTDIYTKGVEFKRLVTHDVVDSLRLAIVAKKEQYDKQIEIDHSYATWRYEVQQYLTNLLAAGHGGGGTVAGAKPSQAQSALGGALAGAGTGAMIGNAIAPGAGAAWGAAIGGVVGAVASFF